MRWMDEILNNGVEAKVKTSDVGTPHGSGWPTFESQLQWCTTDLRV